MHIRSNIFNYNLWLIFYYILMKRLMREISEGAYKDLPTSTKAHISTISPSYTFLSFTENSLKIKE